MTKNMLMTLVVIVVFIIIANINLNLGIGLFILLFSVLTLLFIRKLWLYYMSTPDRYEENASRRKFIKNAVEGTFYAAVGGGLFLYLVTKYFSPLERKKRIPKPMPKLKEENKVKIKKDKQN